MPKVEGPLKTVLQNPTQVTGVWVRSGQDRTDGTGMILDEPDKATLANGVVSFTAAPGLAVLVLERAGGRPTTMKIMVGTADSSLADAVKAASVAGHLDSHRLAQLVGMIEATQKNAADAAAAATRAETARSLAEGERNNAEQARDEARDAADRAEAVADSVYWQDDRLSVMGVLGPPLRGPKGDSGDGTGDGAGDVLWSELNPVLDGKASVSHDHTIAQVTGLQDELDGKASTDHTHTPASIGAAPASHTHPEYATTAQVEARTPEIRVVSSPELATSPGVLYVVMED